MIQNKVDAGALDLTQYKQIIASNLLYEKEILKRAEEDSTLNGRDIVMKRIRDRIEIIETEIQQNVDESCMDSSRNSISEASSPTKRGDSSIIEVTSPIKVPKKEEQAITVNNKNEIIEESKLETTITQSNKTLTNTISLQESKVIKDPHLEQLKEELKNRLSDYKKAINYFVKVRLIMTFKD
jgi:hypothetical protein